MTDKILILAYFVPVDDAHAIISLRFYNKITGVKAVDKMIAWLGSRANTIVERQDKRVVETQRPLKTGIKIGESLVQADLPIVEYRTKRSALQNKKETAAEAPGKRGGRQMVEMNTKAMYKLYMDYLSVRR